MIDNYFTYYTEIEEYFVRKRKKNLLISPLDWCLIEIWKENRIPLHIVFRGIDRSFESAAGKGKKPPTTLYYCLPAVMEAFTEYQEALVGKADAGEESAASPEEPSSREIAHYLEGLRDTVEGLRRVDLPEDPLRTAVRRLADLEEEVVSSAGLRPGDIDRELDAISADLADALYGILSEEEQEEDRGAVQVPDPFLKNVLAMRKANEAVRDRARELGTEQLNEQQFLKLLEKAA